MNRCIQTAIGVGLDKKLAKLKPTEDRSTGIDGIIKAMAKNNFHVDEVTKQLTVKGV